MTGGACVAIWSDGAYQSKDLDFVEQGVVPRRAIRQILHALGLTEENRCFTHPDAEFFIEFPGGPLAVGDEPVRETAKKRLSTGTLRLLTPTDCVKDRLAAWFHWNDRQSLEQAVLVAKAQAVDIAEIRRWARSLQRRARGTRLCARRSPLRGGNAMRLNDDMSQRVVLHTATMPWVASPVAGVERRMLDRVGAEIARATSLVRYAPASRFSPHVHGGEEFLVLEGVFSDEHGDFPAGSYLRNPPGTAHAPRSAPGCTIFVKLWQFAAGDTEPVHIDSRTAAWQPGPVPGMSVLPLHAHGGITTVLERWAPGTTVAAHAHPGGEEILVLEGSLHDEHGDYPAHTWLRNPRDSRHAPRSGPEGALTYQKTGHIGARWLALPGADRDGG